MKLPAPYRSRRSSSSAAFFDASAAIKRAEAILSLPPSHPHIERPTPRGELVARFALPLELLKPQNRTRHAKPWMLGKMKQELWVCLLRQCKVMPEAPLTGRPQVFCVRFSSVEPDAYSDGFKSAVDALCVPKARRKRGLGFLSDDKPRDVDMRQWWEFSPPGKGFGLIQIFASG